MPYISSASAIQFFPTGTSNAVDMTSLPVYTSTIGTALCGLGHGNYNGNTALTGGYGVYPNGGYYEPQNAGSSTGNCNYFGSRSYLEWFTVNPGSGTTLDLTTGSFTTYGDGDYWVELPRTGTDWYYFVYHVNSGVISVDSGSPQPTTITSFTYSTTTQMARVQGYWNATTTNGVYEKLEFWQRTNLFGVEDHVYYIATTTGNYDFSFFFHGLPYTSSTSTLDKSIGLYAWISQIDDRNVDPNWNPFTDGANPTGRVVDLLVSTSTIINAFDYGITIPPFNPVRDVSYESCKLTHLDIGDCLANIIVGAFKPSPDDWNRYLTELNDEIYIHAPLGYIKRFRDIVTDTQASTMPVIDYTFSTSTNSALSSILGGERIYFAPFDYATGTSITSIKSDGANGLPEKNIWEIMSPFYTLVIYLAMVIMIVGQLLGLEMIDSGGGGKVAKGLAQNQNYKLKEKLYKMERGKYNKIFN